MTSADRSLVATMAAQIMANATVSDPVYAVKLALAVLASVDAQIAALPVTPPAQPPSS